MVCNGTTCEVGTCSAGTKKCGQNCVPVDANNGCQEAGRCTPCASNQVCVGSPSTCQCVAESPATTCAGKACGSATNNCGQTIACTDTCANLGAGYACNVGGAGPNSCGCVPDNTAACAGKQCGPAVNNCGQAVQCPDTCSTLGTQYACGANGAGPNQCGCTPLTKFQACGYQECGSVPNGCGANVNCGNCPGGQYCRCEFQCMSGTICP